MKHDKHELTYKKFVKAKKRLDELNVKMRGLPYRKLEEPYQSGWVIIPVLREDLLRSTNGPLIQSLIEKYGQSIGTKSSKLVSKIRKSPSLSYVNSILPRYYIYGVHIKKLTKKEYDSLNEREKKYFNIIPKWRKRRENDPEEYEFYIPQHYLVVKVKKRMITHVQDIDPVLKKEEVELRKILEPYWRQLPHHRGYEYYWKNRGERRQSKVDIIKINLTEE